MKAKLYFLSFIVISALAASCKSATKLYEKGNYDEAVELAAKKLQKDPDDPKLLDVIRNAYQYAVQDHESRIRSNSQSTSDLRFEWIYNEYVSLQRLYDAIYRVPQVYEIIRPADYSSYVVTYREKAGDMHFDRGMSFMQQDTREGYRNAYREFQAALRFIPGDRDAQNRLDEAYAGAVTNVIILPVQQNGGYVYSSYTIGGQNVDDNLVRNLQQSSGNEFVKFWSAWDARSRNIRADVQLDMQFTRIDLGNTRDSRKTRKVSRDVVIKEIVYKPDSVVKVYGKVSADIITTTRYLSSSAIMNIRMVDAGGRRIWSEDFASDYAWSTDFSTYKGDNRALSETDKQLVDRRPQPQPSDKEVMECMLDEITKNAIYRIRNYADRL